MEHGLFINTIIKCYNTLKGHAVDKTVTSQKPSQLPYKFFYDICSTSKARESLVHSYGRSFNGFAAKLSDAEVAKFSGTDLTFYLVNESGFAFVSEKIYI